MGKRSVHGYRAANTKAVTRTRPEIIGHFLAMILRGKFADGSKQPRERNDEETATRFSSIAAADRFAPVSRVRLRRASRVRRFVPTLHRRLSSFLGVSGYKRSFFMRYRSVGC